MKKTSLTLILIILNFVFFFFYLFFVYYYKGFIDYVALKPSNFFKGKNLWTIVTSMFIHANLFHLFANMVSLLFLGSFLERIIGRKRFAFIYFISGIVAGLFFIFFSLLIKNEFNSYAVGASGAIFGIIGTIVVLTPKLKVFVFPIPFPIPLFIASLIALFGLWIVSIFAGLPIGNTAHLGGFVSGLIYGFYLRIKYKRKIKILNRYLR